MEKGSPRIIIIEDDEEMCEELGEILRDNGYSVDTAFDGLEGKRLLTANTYAIIIMDLKMPKMSGHELLEFVKSKKPANKVLIISGTPSLDDEPELLSAEEHAKYEKLRKADGLINKPFDIEEVLAKLKALIGER